MNITVTQKRRETSILQKLTYFFGGMFLYSILFGFLLKLIGVWGAILALVTGISCSIILIVKKHKGSQFRVLSYGVLTAITIWFLVAISVEIGMLYIIW